MDSPILEESIIENVILPFLHIELKNELYGDLS